MTENRPQNDAENLGWILCQVARNQNKWKTVTVIVTTTVEQNCIAPEPQGAHRILSDALAMKRVNPRREASVQIPLRLMQLFHSDPKNIPAPRGLDFTCVNANPNIFLIHDFIKEKELHLIDEILNERLFAFDTSHTEDCERNQVISSERTSTHTFFRKGENAIVRKIEDRASDFVGLPSVYVEPIQIVRYANGQKFDIHHDAGTLHENGDVSLVPPRRLVTFFFYLNTLHDGIGATVFPKLDLEVQPSERSALLFCNVLPDGSPDPRVVHYAREVTFPFVKFGMNLWICDVCQFDDAIFSDAEPPERALKGVPKFTEDNNKSVLKDADEKRLEYIKRKFVENQDNKLSLYWSE